MNLGKTIFIEKGQSCLHQDCPTETKGAKPSPYLIYNDKYIISESFVSSIITKFMNFFERRDSYEEKSAKKRYIFRPYITVNGKRIYATAYGHKAFKISVA